MAQVSVVTAARRELAGALNPDAREFLPWWRLGGSRKQLSADAPEFTRSSLGRAVAAAAANGAVIAAPNNAGVGKAAVSTQACLGHFSFPARSCSRRLPSPLLYMYYYSSNITCCHFVTFLPDLIPLCAD